MSRGVQPPINRNVSTRHFINSTIAVIDLSRYSANLLCCTLLWHLCQLAGSLCSSALGCFLVTKLWVKTLFRDEEMVMTTDHWPGHLHLHCALQLQMAPALMLLVNAWLLRIQTGYIGHCFYTCLETSNPLYSGVHVIYHTWRDRLYFNDKKSGIIIWCGSIGEEKGDMESLETMGRGWRHIFTNIKSASSAAGCGVLRCIDGV